MFWAGFSTVFNFEKFILIDSINMFYYMGIEESIYKNSFDTYAKKYLGWATNLMVLSVQL